MEKHVLSSAQIRAARALLRWSAADLAKASSLGANTIRRAEVAEDGTSLTAANELAVRRALETAGVEFIDENGGGPGCASKRRCERRGKDSYRAAARTKGLQNELNLFWQHCKKLAALSHVRA